jgi:hypothetical protein
VRGRSGWLWRGVAKAIAIAVAVVVFVGVFSWAVMQLWNYVVPPLFHGPVVGYWQALALLVLSRILFGGLRGLRGSHRHWRGHAWRERWESLTPEERARLRERVCGRAGGAAAEGEERRQP